MGREKKEGAGEHKDDRLDQAGETKQTEEIVHNTWNDGEFYSLSFAVDRTRRYHAKMCRFYQSWHDITLASNALLGTAAFVALFGGKSTGVAQVLTGIVAAASSIETVFGPAKKARVHSDLTKRFTDLAAEIAKRDATPANLKWVSAARLKIEKDEPPVRRLVDLQAMNEEYRSRGVDEARRLPLTLLQTYFGYICDFGLGRLEKRIKARSNTAEQ